MGQRYSHLSLEERCRLRGMMEMGLSISEIARRLGRHRSTIQRELERNRCADGYRPDSAARRAWARKLRGSKIERSTRLRAHVEDRLAMGWSPEQIAGRMELDGSEHAISAESIYRHAYSPAGRRRGPAAPARATQAEARPAAAQRPARARHPQPDADPSAADKGPSSQPVRPLGGRPDALPPPARHPPDAAGEALPADAGPSSSQQRCRRHRQAIAAELGGLPANARRTITHDNGGEFARHEAVTDAIGLHAYFCDPHSPWQRGGIENANGRLRRDLPRKTSLGGLHRCRHRRRDLEPQRHASEVPRLPHPDRGLRCQPRCRT